MNKFINETIIKNYIKVIYTIYSIIFLFRLFESTLIFYNYGFRKDILLSELVGLGYDYLGASVVIFIYFIFYLFLSKMKLQIIRAVNISLLFVSALVFFVIIKYFIYQLIPLDIFLYNYSFQEILFTIKTSNTNFRSTILSLTLILSFITLITWSVHKVVFSSRIMKITYSLVLVFLLLFFPIHYLYQNELDKFSINKPVYLISKTISYLSNDNIDYEIENTKEFQKLYPDKKFLSKEYPLVFEKKQKNELKQYFNTFKSSPNIVILIVEGLNDDFIHEYKGSVLMPFLKNLKDNSLYWNRCFTLGERSFAAVPSILGGLPYGDKGFTLQQRLPRHLSLVSILNSNDYYTSFYYGQGAWFHQKDRFFNYNNIDLIFDNLNFSNDYDKIIVGNDNFFWGYNDKDLFNQSLKVIDTLNQNKRLDIYFTGTSHSPFVISDETYYNKKLKDYTTEPYQDFYHTYSKYLKSVLFVDDAIKDFFAEYQKRQDYENTIFIITGDHPMTEIPVANSLKRYHVPLIIFSEKLKINKEFSNIVSHLDISETILSFLQDYIAYPPSISTSLGNELLTKNAEQKNIAFMNDNREVVELLSGDYFLSEGMLFKIDSKLNTVKHTNDSIKRILSDRLNAFKNNSIFVCRNNMIISSDMYCKALNIKKIFERQNKHSLVTSSEYFNLVDKTAVMNTDFSFDISLNVESNKNSDVSIIYQITNSKDSILLWKNFGVNDDKMAQVHLRLNKMPVADSVVYFKSYIWNKNRSDLIISDIDVLLYESKPTSSKKILKHKRTN